MEQPVNEPSAAPSEASGRETPGSEASGSEALGGGLGLEDSTAAQRAGELAQQLDSQVKTLENEVQQIDDEGMQLQVQRLIDLIKTSLQSKTLNAKTQKELARLLSLTPSLNTRRHRQQLNLLDLAVSTLLEPDRLESNGLGPASRSTRRGSAAGSAKNLVFVRETRRQIARQSRTYPDVLEAMLTGRGTPYIRLISGLSWFFVVFVVLPLAVSGLTFAVRDVAGFVAAQRTIAELLDENSQLQAETSRQQGQIDQLTRRRDALAAQLGRTGSQLTEISQPAPNRDTLDNSPNNSEPEGAASGPDSTASESPSPSPEEITQVSIEIEALETIQQEIERELRSGTNRENEAIAGSAADAATTGTAATSGNNGSRLAARAEAAAAESIAAADRVFNTSFSLILLAVAMGALGSTISVIVRANTFIQQAQESDSDLFLTGFFRPFVGMSFAIFCVALVEAGIFSGIFDLTNRKETDRTYFYVAIAFVAGFSERLVRDVVIKTEDTLAGPKGRGGDRWR